MPKSDWPTETEVTSAVEARGGTVPAGVDLTDEIAAAVYQFERLTGFQPFKAETSDSTRNYDTQRYTGTPYVLDFGCGYVSITSISVDGTALVLGTDYWLEPSDAPSDAKPWTRARFATIYSSTPQAIEIVGKRGYASSIPDLAWSAVLDMVNMAVMAAEFGSDVERIKQGPVEIQFKTNAESRVQRAIGMFARF